MTETTPLGWDLHPQLERVTAGEAVLWVRAGDTATVLQWLAWRWSKYVEPLHREQCGGFDHRRNRNSPSQWSEHAGGTAIDLNWLMHPNGWPPSAALVVKVTAALSAVSRVAPGLVRWGGDYSHTKDPMHLELRHRPDQIHDLAEKLRSDRR